MLSLHLALKLDRQAARQPCWCQLHRRRAEPLCHAPHPARMRGQAPACTTGPHTGCLAALYSACRRRCVAHQRGRSRHTRSCCCVVGYANDRHPDAAAAAHLALRPHAERGRGRRAGRRSPGHPTRTPERRQGRSQSAGAGLRRTLHGLTRAGHPVRAHQVQVRLLRPRPRPAYSKAVSGYSLQRGWPPGLQPDNILTLSWAGALAARCRKDVFEGPRAPALMRVRHKVGQECHGALCAA